MEGWRQQHASGSKDDAEGVMYVCDCKCHAALLLKHVSYDLLSLITQTQVKASLKQQWEEAPSSLNC